MWVELDNRAGAVQFGCPQGDCTADEADTHFTFIASWEAFEPAIVASFRPTEVHVHGAGFDNSQDCRCTFARDDVAVEVPAQVVSLSSLTCDGHVWRGAEASRLSISCDGEELSAAPAEPPLTYYFSVAQAVAPARVPAGGGNVSVAGTNLCYRAGGCDDAEFLCLFVSPLQSENVTAGEVSNSSVECPTPVWVHASPARIVVSLFDDHLGIEVESVTGDLSFEVYPSFTEASAVVPCSPCGCVGTFDVCLAASIPNEIAISGFGFDNTSAHYTCALSLVTSGGSEVLASPDVTPTSPSLLYCTIPRLPSTLSTQAGVLSLLFSPGFEADGNVMVRFYPEVIAMHASSGSAHGCLSFEDPCPEEDATIKISAAGLSLDMLYLCRFTSAAGTYVDSVPAYAYLASAVACTLPPWDHPATQLSITLRDAGGNEVHSAGGATFHYTVAPIMTGYAPVRSPGNGTLAVKVFGFGLVSGQADLYECEFRSVGDALLFAAPGVAASDKNITCMLPPFSLPAQTVFLSVRVLSGPYKGTLKMARALGGAPVQFLAEWSTMDVSVSLATGGVETTVLGHGFHRGSNQYSCRFANMYGEARSGAHVASSTRLTCPTPEWPYPEGHTTVTLWDNGAEIPKVGEAHNMTFLAVWALPAKQSASADGGDLITVAGQGFDPAREYVVRFTTDTGRVLSEPVFAADAQTLVFPAPELGLDDYEQNTTVELLRYNHSDPLYVAPEPMNVTINVTINATNATNVSVPLWSVNRSSWDEEVFQYVAMFETMTSAWEALFGDGARRSLELSGPVSGGVVLHVIGRGFRTTPGYTYSCRFSATGLGPPRGVQLLAESAEAAAINSTHVECVTPEWGLDGTPLVTLLRHAPSDAMFLRAVEAQVTVQFHFVAAVLKLSSYNELASRSRFAVFGRGFDKYIKYFCVFQRSDITQPWKPLTNMSVPATVVSEEEIVCDHVEWTEKHPAGRVSLYLQNELPRVSAFVTPPRLALPGFLAATALPFSVYLRPEWDALTPSNLSAFGTPVTISGQGLMGSLFPGNRTLDAEENATLVFVPDLDIGQAAGMMFEVYARRNLSVAGFDVDLTLVDGGDTTGDLAFWSVFWRQGPIGDFRTDLSGWVQLLDGTSGGGPAQYSVSLDDADAKRTSASITLVAPIALSGDAMASFFVVAEHGVEYDAPAATNRGAGGATFSDFYAEIRGAAAHLVEPRADGAWRFVRSAGSPAAPALMAGALRYANAPLELDRYRCRYVSVDPLFGGEAWTDEALAFSDDLEGGDPLRALSVTCPGTRWGFAEGAANVSVFDGNLILEYVGPANSSAPLVVLRSRWSGLGVRVMDAWGGDALEVNGAGFDQEPNRTNYTCVYSSVTGGSTVVSGSQVVAPTSFTVSHPYGRGLLTQSGWPFFAATIQQWSSGQQARPRCWNFQRAGRHRSRREHQHSAAASSQSWASAWTLSRQRDTTSASFRKTATITIFTLVLATAPMTFRSLCATATVPTGRMPPWIQTGTPSWTEPSMEQTEQTIRIAPATRTSHSSTYLATKQIKETAFPLW